jgi:hypothetical protein
MTDDEREVLAAARKDARNWRKANRQSCVELDAERKKNEKLREALRRVLFCFAHPRNLDSSRACRDRYRALLLLKEKP